MFVVGDRSFDGDQVAPVEADARNLGFGRFLQVDPIGYKDALNLYVYVGDDPMDYTDPTGTEIVDSDAKTRPYIQDKINSLSKTQYNFDKNGVLHADKSLGINKSGSEFYSNQINRGIAGKYTLSVSLSKTMTYSARGQGATADRTFAQIRDIDRQGGGGLTSSNGRQVAISGSSNSDRGVPLTPATILAHELAGHAINILYGGVTGNAVTDENRIRRETGLPERPVDPSHTERYGN